MSFCQYTEQDWQESLNLHTSTKDSLLPELRQLLAPSHSHPKMCNSVNKTFEMNVEVKFHTCVKVNSNSPIVPLNLLSHLLHASAMLHLSLICTPALLLLCNFAVCTNTFCDLDKYVLQFGRIQFAIGRNAFCDLNKYYLPHTFAPLTGGGVTRLAPRSSCTNLFTSTATTGSRTVQTPVKCKPAMSHIFKDISIGNKTS